MHIRLVLLVGIFLTFLPLALTLSPLAPVQADSPCDFRLGFKAIRDMIPDIVGGCVDNEHYNPQNGDALQNTTGPTGAGGLLAWRKSDNWTAFTDGYWTWINGPYGLQQRLNTERFPWEVGPPGSALSGPSLNCESGIPWDIAIAPTSGPPGTSVTIAGCHMRRAFPEAPAGQPFQLEVSFGPPFGGSLGPNGELPPPRPRVVSLGNVLVDVQGNFSAVFRIPPGYPADGWPFILSYANAGTMSPTFTVTSP